MTDPLLSVVIPAYNEEDRLGSSLEQIVSYLEGRTHPFELIVVDDGSTDGTFQIGEVFSQRRQDNWSLRVVRNETNRGKGYSVRRGMLDARGTYALFSDADLSTPIQEIAKLEAEVIEGPFQVAFGSRDLVGSRIEVHQSRARETGGRLFNRIMRCTIGLPFRDTQCGFKLFQMDRCKDIFAKQRLENFGFDAEVLYLARKWGFRMKEVPVVWRHDAGSKVHFLADGLALLWSLLEIRRNDLLGRYDRVSEEGTQQR